MCKKKEYQKKATAKKKIKKIEHCEHYQVHCVRSSIFQGFYKHSFQEQGLRPKPTTRQVLFNCSLKNL